MIQQNVGTKFVIRKNVKEASLEKLISPLTLPHAQIHVNDNYYLSNTEMDRPPRLNTNTARWSDAVCCSETRPRNIYSRPYSWKPWWCTPCRIHGWYCTEINHRFCHRRHILDLFNIRTIYIYTFIQIRVFKQDFFFFLIKRIFYIFTNTLKKKTNMYIFVYLRILNTLFSYFSRTLFS